MPNVTKVCTRTVTVLLRDGSRMKFFPGRLYTIPEEVFRNMKPENFTDAPEVFSGVVSDGAQVDGQQVMPAEEAVAKGKKKKVV